MLIYYLHGSLVLGLDEAGSPRALARNVQVNVQAGVVLKTQLQRKRSPSHEQLSSDERGAGFSLTCMVLSVGGFSENKNGRRRRKENGG